MLDGILRATEDGSVVQAVRIRVDGVQENGIQHGRGFDNRGKFGAAWVPLFWGEGR